MPLPSPASPYQQLNQPAVQFQVWIGPTDGTAPAAKHVDSDYFPVSAHITASSRRDDVLTVHTKNPARIMDWSPGGGLMGRQVEIRALDDKGNPTNVISWGFSARQPARVDEQSEIYAIEARIGEEHFGNKLELWPTWDANASSRLNVGLALAFNPEIDGIIEPNKSDKTDSTNAWNYVLHPESIRTAASQTFQQHTASLWTMADAVLAVCWWLNPSETYIKNPTRADVDAAFATRNELLKNVVIPLGTSLPLALDLLIAPLEYGWHLKHGLDSNGNRQTTIRFYQRGTGPKRNLQMQRAGETRDIRKTQVLSFDALTSIVDLANRVIVYGDYIKREVTVVLAKAWETQYDTQRLSDLKEGTTFSTEHPEVGRKWVLDTAGDYIGLRPELTAPYDLGTLFTDTALIRRRKFTRCLSQHTDADDRESNGYRVDWYNSSRAGATDYRDKHDPGWVRVKWSFAVLEKEAGIFFDGDTVPLQLWALIYGGTPDLARVRITATLTGDRRVKGDAVRQAASSNAQDLTLVLEMPDKFQNSKVDTSTNYGSIFSDHPTLARDDTAAILSYAQQVRSAEDAIRLDTSIPLEGALHPEYQIGDVLPLVAGRNLSLQLAANRYPQVVGVVHHFQGQQVELLLESFRKERPRVVLDNGNRLAVGATPPNVQTGPKNPRHPRFGKA